MVVPKPEDVLSVNADDIAEFISSHTGTKTLSVLMKRLNQDLFSEDDTASAMAGRALQHLGFDAYP